MGEGTNALNEDHLRVLRQDLEKLAMQSEFRKKFIGGISEDDVNKCINNLYHQFDIIEKELKTHIVELESSVDQLLKELDTYKRSAEGDKAKLRQENDNALADASRYLNECKHKDDMIADLNDNYNSEINSLITDKKQLESENTQLCQQNRSLEQEIEGLHNEVTGYSADMKGLSSRIEELEEDLLASQYKIEEQTCVCAKLENEFEQEKTRSASLNKEIEILQKQALTLQESLHENQERIQQEYEERLETERALELERNKTSEHNNTINMLNNRIEQLETQLQETEKMIEEQANENGNHTFEQIDAIHKQLDALKEQLRINDMLKQQVELERSRADKAENDVSRFREWALELKEKFYQDQKQLEIQLAEIETKNRTLRGNLENLHLDTVLEIDELCTENVPCNRVDPEDAFKENHRTSIHDIIDIDHRNEKPGLRVV